MTTRPDSSAADAEANIDENANAVGDAGDIDQLAVPEATDE